MSSKKEELAEIEVLSAEQIEQLPKVVKKNVVYLHKEIRPKELAVLNPIVSKILSLQERVEKAVYDPENEKESIATYKAIKSEIGSFNSKWRETGKQLKEPYNDIKSKIIEIEGSIKEMSDTIKNSLFEKFDVYLKGLEAKKKEVNLFREPFN